MDVKDITAWKRFVYRGRDIDILGPEEKINTLFNNISEAFYREEGEMLIDYMAQIKDIPEEDNFFVWSPRRECYVKPIGAQYFPPAFDLRDEMYIEPGWRFYLTREPNIRKDQTEMVLFRGTPPAALSFDIAISLAH